MAPQKPLALASQLPSAQRPAPQPSCHSTLWRVFRISAWLMMLSRNRRQRQVVRPSRCASCRKKQPKNNHRHSERTPSPIHAWRKNRNFASGQRRESAVSSPCRLPFNIEDDASSRSGLMPNAIPNVLSKPPNGFTLNDIYKLMEYSFTVTKVAMEKHPRWRHRWRRRPWRHRAPLSITPRVPGRTFLVRLGWKPRASNHRRLDEKIAVDLQQLSRRAHALR